MIKSDNSSFSRREFLATLGALSLVTGCAPTNVSTATGSKKLVWLNMDQAELDAAYSQGNWAPNAKEVLARYQTNSEAARSKMDPPLRVPYGDSAMEAMDVYKCEQPNAPIHIFIHGGAWRGGSAAMYAFLAEPSVAAGAHFVIPDFSPVQDVDGNLEVLARQVRRAIAYVYREAPTFGGDPSRIFLSGHSSGGHLAAVALTTDWASMSVPADIIKGGLLCSGMYDLKPVRLSARSEYISFTDDMENNLSPQRHLDLLNAPVVIAHGTNESPEFQRQARDFNKAIRDAGKNSKLIVAKNYNHFEILETMATQEGLLGKAALQQMKLI